MCVNTYSLHLFHNLIIPQPAQHANRRDEEYRIPRGANRLVNHHFGEGVANADSVPPLTLAFRRAVPPLLFLCDALSSRCRSRAAAGAGAGAARKHRLQHLQPHKPQRGLDDGTCRELGQSLSVE